MNKFINLILLTVFMPLAICAKSINEVSQLDRTLSNGEEILNLPVIAYILNSLFIFGLKKHNFILTT